MLPQEQLIAHAIAEEGYLEKASNSQLDSKTANAGSGNWTKYGKDLDSLGKMYNGKKNGYAWCDQFVDWNFVKVFGFETGLKLLCQPERSYGAGCAMSAQYYKEKGQFFTKNPQAGDQIFFKNTQGPCHTGIVTKVDSTKVYTIEGNTSSAAGVVANGGCVRQKSYALNYAKIYGYGRPDWSLVEEDEEMTQQDFNKYMDAYLAELAVRPATPSDQGAIDWARDLGILLGDKQGQMMPKKFITRGEVMVVLKRLVEKLGL